MDVVKDYMQLVGVTEEDGNKPSALSFSPKEDAQMQCYIIY